MKTKILITGAGGMLGTDLSSALAPFFDVVGAGLSASAPHLKIPYRAVDLSDPEAAQALIQTEKPALIFHAAAMTDVDGCERNHDLAIKGNLEVTRQVVAGANSTGAFLVFFSTDYVFEGSKDGEYSEDDLPRPLNSYGESKRFAEIYIQENSKHYVIIRLSWLYGFNGKSFPRTLLERTPQQKKFDVVNDQTGRPTYTRDLAGAFAGILKDNPRAFEKWDAQIFHFANEGSATWAQFAEYIFKQAGHEEAMVTPISSDQLGRPAKRPRNSVMALGKAQRLMGVRFRPWQDAFLDFLREFQQQECNKGAV